jgi:hypothetical protein
MNYKELLSTVQGRVGLEMHHIAEYHNSIPDLDVFVILEVHSLIWSITILCLPSVSVPYHGKSTLRYLCGFITYETKHVSLPWMKPSLKQMSYLKLRLS